jgi:hypothetical protein
MYNNVEYANRPGEKYLIIMKGKKPKNPRLVRNSPLSTDPNKTLIPPKANNKSERKNKLSINEHNKNEIGF